MKGQLSAEMLILIAVIIAVVAIAATQLLNQAKESATKINQSTTTILSQTVPCKIDSDCTPDKIKCSSGSPVCEYGLCTCK